MPSSAGGAVMSLPSTVAPSAISALAMPRPMPPAQPVTRARSPSRSFVLMLSVSSLEIWSEPMDRTRPTLNQLNIVSGNVDASIAFYRRLGVDIPDPRIWRTATGAHHVSAIEADSPEAARSISTAPPSPRSGTRDGPAAKTSPAAWSWGSACSSREEVDRLYGEMTAAGHRGLQAPWDAFWGARYAIVEDPDGIAVGLHEPDLGQASRAAAGSLMAKTRLDVALVERGLAETRAAAQRLVMAGLVFSGERRLDKPGQGVAADAPIEVRGQPHPYVSRGGLKLEKALDHFAIPVAGRIALDVGSSTGGFTDCCCSVARPRSMPSTSAPTSSPGSCAPIRA